MASFHDVRLPSDVERGAKGGPTFNTSIMTLSSGYEKRNINWEYPKCEYDIGYGLQEIEGGLDAVIAFFYARQAKAYSFRFKDWSDYKIGDTTDTTTKQQIGLGDGATTTFQIVKRYISGPTTYQRIVSKIVSSTDRVWIESSEKTRVGGAPGAGEYSIDLLTGIVTLGDTPAATGGSGPSGEQVVYVICEFDVPVRFNTDHLGLAVEVFNAGNAPDIPLIEVRGE